MISRAYDIAARAHAGQARKSGAPYITHPVAVAAILAGAAADDQTICAALLHDTLEGTGYGLTALRADFGDDIAELVAGAAALDDTIGSRKPSGSVQRRGHGDPGPEGIDDQTGRPAA